MQQPGARSEETFPPQVLWPPHHVDTDTACQGENVFSTNASVKMKLFPISGSHDNVVDDAAMSDTSGHRVHVNPGRVSDTCTHDDHVTVKSETTPDANRHVAIVDTNAVSHTSENNIVVASEVEGVPNHYDVAENESSPPDQHHLGKDTMQGEAAASINNVGAKGNRNPEFYSPTRKLDLTKKLSNKGLSEPLPGDVEEAAPVKKKQNPLKRFFARKKGKFDPLTSDVSQDLLPGTDPDIDGRGNKKCETLTSDPDIDGRGNKKHDTLASKLRLRMGKKKSREALDLNSSLCVGSNLEIHQIEAHPAARTTHRPHSDYIKSDIKVNDINNDFSMSKHNEVSSKGKCKTRGKLTKDNIVVIKSTGKLLSDCGSASLECVSLTREEKVTEETAHPNANGQNHDDHRQSGDSQQHQVLPDNADDLAHLDEMLDHIYANFTPTATGFQLPGRSDDDLPAPDDDGAMGIDGIVQAEMRDVGHLDDEAQDEMRDVGHLDDEAQNGEMDVENIDHKVQEGRTQIENIDILEQEAMVCIENMDIPHEAIVCIEHMDIPHELEMCTENMDDEVQGWEKSRKGKDHKVPEAMRVEMIVERMPVRELIVDKIQEGEIIVERTNEKVQGREVIVEKQDDVILDRKFGTENTNDIYPNHRKVATDNRVYDIDGAGPTMTGESEHLYSVYDEGLRQAKRNSIFSEVSEKENPSITESDPSMETVLGTRHADRLDRLKNELGPSGEDTHAIDFTGGGDESSGVNIVSPGVTDHAPASDTLTADVNKSDDPIYDFVENTPTVDVVPQDETHAIHTEHFWSAPDDVIELEVVTQDLITSSDVTQAVNTHSVISQDGFQHATTIPTVEKRIDTKPEGDVCSCLANEFLDPNQAGLCLTFHDTEEIESDFATNDIPKLDTAVWPSPHSPDTEPALNSGVESVRRRDLDDVDANNRFTERMQETMSGFCRQDSTCKLSADQIVMPSHEIGTNKDDTVQTKGKQTRTNNGLNHLVLCPDPLVIHNVQLNLPSWQTQSPYDQLRPVGELQAASISRSLDKPQIKPKPLTVPSSQHTAETADTHAQAGRRRHQLESHGALADVNVGDPAPNLDPGAGIRMSAVECLKKELAETWTQDLGKKNKGDGDWVQVDKSSSCKLSGGTLQAHSSRVEEKLTTAESEVRDKCWIVESAKGDDNMIINDPISGEATAADQRAVSGEMVNRDPETQSGENCLHSQTEQSRNVAIHQVQGPLDQIASTTPMCPEPHLSESLSGLVADDLSDKAGGTYHLAVTGGTRERNLHQTPDSNTGIHVEKGASTEQGVCKKDDTDSVHRTEVSTNNASDTSTRDAHTRDTEKSGNSENTLYRVTGNTSGDGLDRVTGKTPAEDLGHVTDVEVEAITETADNGGAAEGPDNKVDNTGDNKFDNKVDNKIDNKVDNLVARPGVEMGSGAQRRDMDRDNVYDEISEGAGVKEDVSCLTSKRFQFPWKKKDKKLDKRKEMKDSGNIVRKDNVKVKPTKGKPSIKPQSALKSSQCSRSKSHLQTDKDTSAKRRSGKLKRNSASFTLLTEESFYHEIGEALWQNEGAPEDSSSPSSSISEDNPGYESINYLQTDADNEEREAVSLRQETLGYTRSLLNSADSLGYEIPAKFSPKAMEPGRHNGGAEASRAKQPLDLDPSSRNQETDAADDGAPPRHEADPRPCEDLPAIGADVSSNTSQLQFSSFPTKVDAREDSVSRPREDSVSQPCEDSVSQTDVSGRVGTSGHQFPRETISGDEKPRGDTTDGDNSHTFQACAGHSMCGVSAVHISAESAFHVQTKENREQRTNNREQTIENSDQTRENREQTTENRQQITESTEQLSDTRDSGSSNILKETSLSDTNVILQVTSTAECYEGECSSSPSQSVSRVGRSTGATGSSNSSSNGKEKASMPDKIKNGIAQTKDGSSGLSDNVKADNLTALMPEMVEKTARLGDVKPPMVSKKPGDRSLAVTAKVNVDAHSPPSPHSPHSPHSSHSKQSNREEDVQAPMAAVKNRQMLAGYNQVVKSLAAYFVINNDSDDCHAVGDHTASQGIGCSNNTDLPDNVCRHHNQRGSQVSPDMPRGLYPAPAVEASTNLQSASCIDKHEVELSSSEKIDTGTTPQKHRKSNVFRDQTQETQKVLFRAASYPYGVPVCVHRKSLSLRDTDIHPTGIAVTVMRSRDSTVCTGNHSDITREEVLRRSISLPEGTTSCARKVSHQELSGIRLSATPTCQSTHNQRDCLHQQKHLVTGSEERSSEKFRKITELACWSQGEGIYTDAQSLSNSPPETKHNYVRGIPPIPDIVATPATDEAENLTRPPESEADDMTEYDLPPVRAKRISQSKIWSWPGMSVSHTTEPSPETPLQPASHSLHPPGSSKAEYAAPWEGQGLGSLPPMFQHFNRQSSTETAQPAGSPHHTGSDQGTTDERQTPWSGGPLDERFVVSLASHGKPALLGQDDVETSKVFGRRHRKLPSEGDNLDNSARKSNFLSIMTSLFHRKKKRFNFHSDQPGCDQRTRLYSCARLSSNIVV
ncbi:hypothetical protein BsWGS_23549 [Bradybaena similaris]